jgi:hypothetical protein
MLNIVDRIDIVILNAVKNLVLHHPSSTFPTATKYPRKEETPA